MQDTQTFFNGNNGNNGKHDNNDNNANSDRLKVMSFNIKHDFPLALSRRWGERKHGIAKLILSSGATVVGVQEMTGGMRDDLMELLGGEYVCMGFGRYYGLRENHDEHADILVKTSEADVRFCKTFWLSRQPEQSGSRAFTPFPRICTVVELTLKGSGRRLRVYNTHFDHINALARRLAVRTILDYMQKYNERERLPIILMGDLNSSTGSLPVRTLRLNLHGHTLVQLRDVFVEIGAVGVSNTFHRFSGRQRPGKSPIDYIFVSGEFEVLSAAILTGKVDGMYLSDHFPVAAELKLI